jgi:hypothetical protein
MNAARRSDEDPGTRGSKCRQQNKRSPQKMNPDR